MFTIICNNCNEKTTLSDNQKPKGNITLSGEVEVLFDADVFVECKSCGNEITIVNR